MPRAQGFRTSRRAASVTFDSDHVFKVFFLKRTMYSRLSYAHNMHRLICFNSQYKKIICMEILHALQPAVRRALEVQHVRFGNCSCMAIVYPSTSKYLRKLYPPTSTICQLAVGGHGSRKFSKLKVLQSLGSDPLFYQCIRVL